MKKLDKNKPDFSLHIVEKTSIPGLLVIRRPIFKDDRGFFKEVFRQDEFKKATGISFVPKQWNHSYSKPNVIRGLHAENWNKIVYPVTGKMFAAVADIRPESRTFGKYTSFNFDAKDLRALYIPKGLANSICVVGKIPVHYFYLVDAYYSGKDTRAVAWDDPDIGVSWPIKDPVISKRDRSNPRLRDLYPEKFGK